VTSESPGALWQTFHEVLELAQLVVAEHARVEHAAMLCALMASRSAHRCFVAA
jgi:hypothetical protein